MKAIENDNTHLYFTGEIGVDIQASTFINDIRSVNTSTLTVHFDSLGGNALDGISIYNALKESTTKKVAIIEGVCGSASSYILMAFDKIIAKENTLILLHNPLVESISGNANQLSSVVKTLSELTNIYVDAYTKRTKLTPEKIKELLDNETYINANEGLLLGFVDEVEQNNCEETMNLKAKIKERYVAFINNFMKTSDTETKAYSVEEAESVLQTAKEINTNEAYSLAKSQIEEAISNVEDKTVYEQILSELERLISESKCKDEKEAIEVEPSKEEENTNDLQRRQNIINFAKDINNDGLLDKLLIEALAGEMSLEEFKTQACKKLSVAKSSLNFKATLYANKAVEKKEHSQPVLKVKGDYFKHYQNLIASGNILEANNFYKKYKNIF